MIPMTKRWLLCIPLILISTQECRSDIIVRFEFDQYTVPQAVIPFPVRILIDGDHSTPELDPIPNGLISYGIKMRFDPVSANVASANEIMSPTELDYFGLNPGAFKQVASGTAAVKGNVNFQPLSPPYEDTLLAEIEITNLAIDPGIYTLSLDYFNTLGPSEQIFQDGLGNLLDGPNFQFGTTIVNVVPEPTSGSLLVLVWITIVGRVSRKRSRPAIDCEQ